MEHPVAGNGPPPLAARQMLADWIRYRPNTQKNGNRDRLPRGMARAGSPRYDRAMKRNLLAAFRSADGRSIAQALALIVFVSALIGGVATGNAAAGVADPHCTTSPYGALPPGHDGVTCCPGMRGSDLPYIPPPDALPNWKPTLIEASMPPLTLQGAVVIRIAVADLPRGPPESV